MIKKLYTKCTGQKLLPGFLTLPLSMAVVCRERMDDIQEVLVSREGRKPVATAQDTYMDVGGRQRQEQIVERRAVFEGKVM